MTKEDAIKLEDTYLAAKPVAQLLHCVDRALGLESGLRNPREDSDVVNQMLSSMFYNAKDAEQFIEILTDSWEFEDIAKRFKNDVIHNDQFLCDLIRYHNDQFARLASAEIWETLLNAREKYLLDLKNTLENLLKAIPPPQFSEIETKN